MLKIRGQYPKKQYLILRVKYEDILKDIFVFDTMNGNRRIVCNQIIANKIGKISVAAYSMIRIVKGIHHIYIVRRVGGKS